MKRFVVIFFALLTFSFLGIAPVKAVDQFGCTWQPGAGCVVNDGNNNCGPGWEADRSICSSKTNMNDCNRTVGNCKQIQSVSEWHCESGACVPGRGSPTFAESTCANTCNTNTSQKSYSCDTSAWTCKEDPGGVSQAACAQTCQKPAQTSGSITSDFFPLVHCPSGTTVNGFEDWARLFFDSNDLGIATAIGCIPTGSIKDFVAFLLKWTLGLSGGIIVVMVVATGYNLLTSAGDPQKVQAVKENITSILTGLILIGFSLVLLRVIGADILSIPGF